MAKHSPSVRLSAAKRRLDLAYQECPHWDFESDGDSGHDCCFEVTDARKEVAEARAAIKRQRQG